MGHKTQDLIFSGSQSHDYSLYFYICSLWNVDDARTNAAWGELSAFYRKARECNTYFASIWIQQSQEKYFFQNWRKESATLRQ